ncbi:MAG: cupin domain-containing protein, partial [Spirochaetales bacterium]
KDARRFSSKNALVTGLADEKRPDFAPYHVTLEGHQAVEGPILLHKGKEFIVVVNGSLSLTIDGEEHLLRKGDSILLERSFVEKWGNRGKNDCEFVYIQF